MLVASAATMLTPTAIAAPSIKPAADTPVATKPDCAEHDSGHRGQHSTGQRAQHRRDDGLDEQRGHHRRARHAVGAEHAEFAGAVRDGAGGRHGDLHDPDQQNGHRDQHDGAADLLGVAERRRLRADSVGHAEHDHHEERAGRSRDDRQHHLADPCGAPTATRRTTLCASSAVPQQRDGPLLQQSVHGNQRTDDRHRGQERGDHACGLQPCRRCRDARNHQRYSHSRAEHADHDRRRRRRSPTRRGRSTAPRRPARCST